jgi:hypothetical protein
MIVGATTPHCPPIPDCPLVRDPLSTYPHCLSYGALCLVLLTHPTNIHNRPFTMTPLDGLESRLAGTTTTRSNPSLGGGLDRLKTISTLGFGRRRRSQSVTDSTIRNPPPTTTTFSRLTSVLLSDGPLGTPFPQQMNASRPAPPPPNSRDVGPQRSGTSHTPQPSRGPTAFDPEEWYVRQAKIGGCETSSLEVIIQLIRVLIIAHCREG